MTSLAGKKVWVAGHRGMVGGALVRRLASENCTVLTASRRDADLTRQAETEDWIAAHKPDFKAYLLGGPKVDDFPVERDRDTGRDVEL